MANKIILKKDIVIPAGTEMECISGQTRKYFSGNFESIFSVTKDTFGSFTYAIDENDENLYEWFDIIDS